MTSSSAVLSSPAVDSPPATQTAEPWPTTCIASDATLNDPWPGLYNRSDFSLCIKIGVTVHFVLQNVSFNYWLKPKVVGVGVATVSAHAVDSALVARFDLTARSAGRTTVAMETSYEKGQGMPTFTPVIHVRAVA